MIEFKEVTKTFKTDFWAKPFFALDNLSFSIEEGKLIGFLGANGAGKTTSIKIMMDFIRHDKGEVVYSKSLGRGKKEILSNIGFVPERPYFYPYLTGREFLEYMAKLNDVPRKEVASSIKKWSEIFNIAYPLDRKIHGYSKGMLQRLGFVSSLVHDPKLIVLDEPLSGLDPMGRKEIKDALLELNKRGKTIFFSSHIVSDVEEICEHVVVLQKGKGLYQGSIDELIRDNLSSDYIIKIHSNRSTNDVMPEQFMKSFVAIDDNSYLINCDKEQKDDCLRHLLNARCDILSVISSRPTLEQVIYNIKK